MLTILKKIAFRITLICIPFLIFALLSDGEGHSVIKRAKEDTKIFQENISENSKELILKYIESGPDKTGATDHNYESSLLLLWGGNKNNGLNVKDLRQYRDKEFNDMMKSLGFKIVSPVDNPSSILLVYRNGVKVKEYGPQKIVGYRNDKHFVYFDLEKNQIVELGLVKGQALPKAIRHRSSSSVTTYFGDQASYYDQTNFVRSMLKN